jgi:hypothetical protein
MQDNCCASCAGGGSSDSGSGGGSSGTATGGSSGGGSGTCTAFSAQVDKAHALNIVMVPSAFNNDMARFRQKAQAIYGDFGQFEPFTAPNIKGLNVWYVDIQVASDNGQFCQFGCYNTPRLLCCDGRQTLINHARYHCGSGFVMNVLIVHNDDTYGGAGYPHDGVASVSTNSLSPMIGIHELGHSLFGLGDEYTIGDGNPEQDPNCDSTGCSKWDDLISRGMASCNSGKCRSGGYHSDSDNMMFDYSVRSFGSVNQRISCCKYVYHTGTTPRYCEKFDQGGLSLQNYCNGQLWRGRYTNLNLLQYELHSKAGSNSSGDTDTQYMLDMAEDTQGDQFAFVEHPVQWMLVNLPSKDDEQGSWFCKMTPEVLASGLYIRGAVVGDYNHTTFSGRHRKQSESARFVEVEVLAGKGGSVDRHLFFETQGHLEVPHDADGRANTAEDEAIFEDRPSIEVILRKGEQCRVRTETGTALAQTAKV